MCGLDLSIVASSATFESPPIIRVPWAKGIMLLSKDVKKENWLVFGA